MALDLSKALDTRWRRRWAKKPDYVPRETERELRERCNTVMRRAAAGEKIA